MKSWASHDGLEQNNSLPSKKIEAENVPRNLAFPIFLIGRENTPPLKNTDSPLQILKDNRCCQIEAPQELMNVFNEILNNAWSVDNDAYLFTMDGNHLLYVSHHDRQKRMKSWASLSLLSEVGHQLGLSQSAVSRAVPRGEKIAEEGQLSIDRNA